MGIALVGCVVHTAMGYSAYDLSGHALGSDDAWISYRYAWNLAQGHGLVFNPGEPVEGYSNLLYVLAMAAVFTVSSSVDIFLVSVLLNTACVGVSCFLMWRFARSQLGETAGLWAAFLFALSPMVWLWASSGLETTVVLLGQLGIWFAVEKVRAGPSRSAMIALGAWSVGMILLRADGFLVPLAAALYLGLHRHKLATAVQVGCVVVAQGALTAFRLAYYGYPLPNTYYAKVSGPLLERFADGFERLSQVTMSSGLLAGLVAIAVAAFFWARSARTVGVSGLRFELLFPVLWLGYWFYIGGDHFFERFLLVLYPMGAVVALRLLTDSGAKAQAWAFACLLLVGMQLGPLAIDPRCDYVDGPKYDRWVELGTYLGKTYPGKRLATDAAGKLPYFSGLETVDTLGLNDTHIARIEVDKFRSGHSKHDAPYVLSRQPDLIAGWIEPTLDLRYGMDRALYKPAGYRVTHLVNSSARSVEPNIVNTRGKTRRDITLLIASGYQYAVLVRGPAPEDPRE